MDHTDIYTGLLWARGGLTYTVAPYSLIAPPFLGVVFGCCYWRQVELNGWLPRGPIEKGTIESIADYLNFTRGFDFTAIMPL